MIRFSTCGWTSLLVMGCVQQAPYVPPVKQSEAEVSQGEFVTFERWDWSVDDPKNKSGREKTKLRIPYRDGIVDWEGVDIPVVLREKGDRLYMVGYDRETGRVAGGGGRQTFHYFRQDGDRFIEIMREDFPKDIATQNLWLHDPDQLVAVLKLDTSSVDFLHSINAKLWQHLMTGEVKNELPGRALLDDFVQTYQPQKLTRIKRNSN